MNKFKIVRLVESIMLVIFGIVFIVWPTTIYQVITILLGILLLMDGTFNLIAYFFDKSSRVDKTYRLITSIIFIVVALVLLIVPSDITKASIGLIFGLGLTLLGLAILSKALLERKTGQRWVLSLVFSIVLIILSFLMFANLNQTAEWIVRIIGAVIIYIGLSNIFNLFFNKKNIDNRIDIDFTKKSKNR